MPGKATPVALSRAPIGQNKLGVSHAVSDAELAVAGNWSCRVTMAPLGDFAGVSRPLVVAAWCWGAGIARA
jgi:hypothetical protein